jgi:hypothetical protein
VDLSPLALPQTHRKGYRLSLQNLEEYPSNLAVGPGSFVTLLCSQASGLDHAAIARFTQKSLAQGCVAFACWGRECEAVHAVVDAVIVAQEMEEAQEPPDSQTILTTFHTNTSFQEALVFAVTALPAEGFVKGCEVVLVVEVG